MDSLRALSLFLSFCLMSFRRLSSPRKVKKGVQTNECLICGFEDHGTEQCPLQLDSIGSVLAPSPDMARPINYDRLLLSGWTPFGGPQQAHAHLLSDGSLRLRWNGQFANALDRPVQQTDKLSQHRDGVLVGMPISALELLKTSRSKAEDLPLVVSTFVVPGKIVHSRPATAAGRMQGAPMNGRRGFGGAFNRHLKWQQPAASTAALRQPRHPPFMESLAHQPRRLMMDGSGRTAESLEDLLAQQEPDKPSNSKIEEYR